MIQVFYDLKSNLMPNPKYQIINIAMEYKTHSFCHSFVHVNVQQDRLSFVYSARDINGALGLQHLIKL